MTPMLAQLVASALVAWPPAAGVPGKAASPPGLEQIVAEIRASRSRIEGLSLTYSYIIDEGITPGNDGSRPVTRGYLHHYLFSNKKMTRETNTADLGNKPYLGEEESPCVFLDEDELVKWWPRSRIIKRRPMSSYSDRGRDLDLGDPYSEAVGFWPDVAGQPDPPDLFLPAALVDHPYAVRPVFETIDGATCVVVERAGKDTIWLDPARSYAIRKRRWRELEPGEGPSRVLEFEARDLREVVPGAWFPWLTRTAFFQPDPKAPDRLLLARIGQAYVGNLSAVDEATESFAPELQAGTLFLDETKEGGERQKVLPGGEEILDGLIARNSWRYEPLGRGDRGPWILAEGLLWSAVAWIALLSAFAMLKGRAAPRGGRVPAVAAS